MAARQRELSARGKFRRETEAPGSGYRLTPYDPDFARQMALADDVMRDDREVLRALAK